MAIATNLTSPAPSDDEGRLNAFGLSTELIQDALRPGLTRAFSRTALALASSPGTDIYHDTMEQLAMRLAASGWRLVSVNRQPRLLHPEGIIALALASATNVASRDDRHAPRTRHKGPATCVSLAGPRAQLTLFEDPELTELAVLADTAAPLWFLVHERTKHGLYLALARPAEMSEGGIVDKWADWIPIPFLARDTDLAIFTSPDDSGFDVPVEPLP